MAKVRPVPVGLEGFQRLNSAVYSYSPAPVSTAPAPSHQGQKLEQPQACIVVLVGWLNARPAHIAKYIAGYKKLNPLAHILVITSSTADMVLGRGAISNLKGITPVLEILAARQAEQPKTPVLLHFFSNGGTTTTTFLANAYHARFNQPLPITAMVIDSAPGRLHYAITLRALVVGLPKRFVLRVVGLLFIHFFWGAYCLVRWLTRQKDWFEDRRKGLNTPELFPLSAPRLYVYSIADDMVDWRFVEEHAAEAEKAGYLVDEERYLESGHARHLIQDEVRYWNAVSRTWQRAFTTANGL